MCKNGISDYFLKTGYVLPKIVGNSRSEIRSTNSLQSVPSWYAQPSAHRNGRGPLHCQNSTEDLEIDLDSGNVELVPLRARGFDPEVVSAVQLDPKSGNSEIKPSSEQQPVNTKTICLTYYLQLVEGTL